MTHRPPAEARPNTVHVLLHVASPDADEWRRTLAAALPEASIAVWPEAAKDAAYLVLWRPPPELFAAAPGARAIFNLGAGVDGLMMLPTLPRGVPVIRLEDAGMADQMVDYVTLAVLAAYREQRIYAAQQRARRWHRRPFVPKASFTVGLLGLGVLGRKVAAGLGHYGFPLTGWSRERKSVDGVRTFAGRSELPDFLAATRALVCLVPLTPETRGLVDRERLAQLPRGAHVINVARGDIVVEADLLAALDSGHLESATLDVFHEEPLPEAHPFWHHPRITLTPHSSAITLIGDSVAQIAQKIRRIEHGLPVTGIIDRTLGY